MDDDFWVTWIFLMIVAGGFWLFGGRSKLDDCRELIRIANERIDVMGDSIQQAKNSYDYESMSYAISNLEWESPVANISDSSGKNKCLEEK